MNRRGSIFTNSSMDSLDDIRKEIRKKLEQELPNSEDILRQLSLEVDLFNSDKDIEMLIDHYKHRQTKINIKYLRNLLGNEFFISMEQMKLLGREEVEFFGQMAKEQQLGTRSSMLFFKTLLRLKKYIKKWKKKKKAEKLEEQIESNRKMRLVYEGLENSQEAKNSKEINNKNTKSNNNTKNIKNSEDYKNFSKIFYLKN